MSTLSVLAAAAITLSPVFGPVYHAAPVAPVLSPAHCYYRVFGAHHRGVSVTAESARYAGTPVTVEVVKGGAAWITRTRLGSDGIANVHAPFGGAGSRHYVYVGLTHCERDWS